MGEISSGNIYVYYCKLPDKSKSNRKKTVELDAFYIILDLAKFSYRSFWDLHRSKKYGPEVKNISTRPNKPKKIFHVQKLIIISWQGQVPISNGIFLPFATIYQFDNYK